MTTKTKRPYTEMRPIADELLEILRPVCERIEIAGSLRRRRPEVGDIELVAIPKFATTEVFDVDLLGTHPAGSQTVNELWHLLEARGVPFSKKGDKYRQFGWKGIQVDLFTAKPETWGWIFLVRTGSADFSHGMAYALNQRGYTSKDGQIVTAPGGLPMSTPTEEDVFRLACRAYVSPEKRN